MATSGTTRINTKIKGLLTTDGFKKYAQSIQREKDRAYKQAIPQAVKETKKELTSKARGSFKVQSKTFAGMFTAKKYDSKKDKLPAVLFFTRSNYFSIFEFGGNIKPKKAKGLFIPFPIDGKSPYQKRNGKKNFKTLLENLKKQGKTFWKKVNGNLILYAIIDKSNSKSLTKYRKSYKTRNSLKQVKSGTPIPMGVMKKSVSIQRRFAFSSIANQTYIPKVINSFESNINL